MCTFGKLPKFICNKNKRVFNYRRNLKQFPSDNDYAIDSLSARLQEHRQSTNDTKTLMDFETMLVDMFKYNAKCRASCDELLLNYPFIK